MSPALPGDTPELIVLTTGGTIDKAFSIATSKLIVDESFAAVVLPQLRLTVRYSIRELLRVDSLDLTPEDRLVISKAVAEAPVPRVVITHGTDTMVESARVVDGANTGQNHTVVFTGAFIPGRFSPYEACFNLGVAMRAALTLRRGVYIAMNGSVRPWREVHKDQKLNAFVAE